MWKKRGEDLRAQASAKEWLDPSPRSMVRISPSSPEYPHTSLEPCTGYAWTVGGPCLYPSLVYAEERYPSTTSYLTAESARLTSPQSPVVEPVWDSHCASEARRCGTSRAGACSVPQPNLSTAARWQPTCRWAGRPRTSLAPPVLGLTPGDGGNPPSTQCTILPCF